MSKSKQKHYKLRGVNLGGWLVLEWWITPSLFAGTDAKDEYGFMQDPGAAEKIERHRKEFIVESDFAWLEEHGVNAVRIPIGYWVINGDEPYAACVSHLDWAVEMAEKYNLKVLLCMHGAPGSQNGNDHSGKIGHANWFKEPINRNKTIQVLSQLAERYRESPALWGVELLNEPKLGPLKYFMLTMFYRQAYRAVSDIVRPDTYVVFSDGFAPWLFTGAVRHRRGVPVAMDIHWYQFGFTKLHEYFEKVARRPFALKWLQVWQPVIIGEWSGMLSHLTLENVSAEQQILLQNRHISEQLKAYEHALGWFYWTYKTEEGGIWNYRVQVEQGNFLLR